MGLSPEGCLLSWGMPSARGCVCLGDPSGMSAASRCPAGTARQGWCSTAWHGTARHPAGELKLGASIP